MKLETVNLKHELEQQPPYIVDRVRRKLVGVQMLACVQTNLMDDIKALLEETGAYRYQLKHNLKQIRDLCSRNIRNESFFGRLSQEAVDRYMDDYERLEKMIYDFIDD